MTVRRQHADRQPYLADPDVTLWHGDALEVLRGMKAETVDCVVTSPPYYQARDYGVAEQLGLESSPFEYVARLRGVFSEVRRVLRKDGVCFLNLGDSYSSASGGAPLSGTVAANGQRRRSRPRAQDYIPEKNLLLIPARVAIALQSDGWTVRNHIVWHKTNGMPGPWLDRFTNQHETIYLLSPSAHYRFFLDSVRVPHQPGSMARAGRATSDAGDRQWAMRNGARLHGVRFGGKKGADGPTADRLYSGNEWEPSEAGRNPGDVWSVGTANFPGEHDAVMPEEIARRCILAGTEPGDTILDPFVGSGTTLLVARNHGRHSVGIDLNEEYLKLAATRLQQLSLLTEAAE